ncbi:MAG: endolytic transglycosylase MltG [Bacteroidales bacterium]|nr:endolytic transglycosylase MltG [Bacteroidales bacterium]
MNNRRDRFSDSIAYILPGLVLLISVFALIRFYLLKTESMIDLKSKETAYLYIPTRSDFRMVKLRLQQSGYLRDPGAFEWLARRKKYTEKVKPGRYKLRNGMKNNELVNLLRIGKQDPVRVIFQNIRTPEDLAGKIGHFLEVDSSALIQLFNDPVFLHRYGLTPSTVFLYFIPNTYEFFWNTSGEELFERMKLESGKFWSNDRRLLADSLNLTIAEVVTLASIVEKESNKNDEKQCIAGVYYNRLRKNMPLQADPTVIFAWKDFSIKRVLQRHLEIKSPYNTYLQTGLPPGPICLPSIVTVDAVLHLQHHDYLYFCAREDLSGYHNFASTLAQHTRNAKKYQNALNLLNIK